MGNDQHGVTRREFGQLLLDRPIRLDIERRGRFVQNQNRRVLQEHVGNRQPLVLLAGQLHPSLSDYRVHALLLLADEPIKPGSSGRLP